ncbi:MAG TPA: Gfo/Idh/MocA family oxidoreductase [bacterium]|nr:MAG: Inositol 2-dehydrogenase [bacterium ADurb.Bin236]HPI76133.1 Gfo/Idh/MocA family oxidoreductase [bacterium]HPN94552.1 Gfo/Idh/MocA family oxidoreductase [bacterium]
MKPIRVGVVGLGMVAQIMHLPYLKESDDFEIAAVCDISPKLVKKVGDHFGVEKRCSDIQEMVKSDIDAVFILTFYHSDATAAAARAGKHIFCEKPVAFSVKECDEMLRAVDRAGVTFMVGYMKRFDPGYLHGLKLFNEMKKKGDVRLIRVHDACFQNDLAIGSMYNIWKYDDIPSRVVKETNALFEKRVREALGPAPAYVNSAYRLLLETASHDITVLRGAFGDPDRVLHTEIWPKGNWFASTLDYGGEVRCLFDIARTARNWGDENITAYGMTRTVRVNFPNPFHKNAVTTVEDITMNDDSTTFAETHASNAESFQNEIAHFADCVRKKKSPLTSLEEGRKDTALMTQIIRKYKAAKS